MFGSQIVTKKKMDKIVADAENKALISLIEFLKNTKNKVVFGSIYKSTINEPITLIGNGIEIRDCFLFGSIEKGNPLVEIKPLSKSNT